MSAEPNKHPFPILARSAWWFAFSLILIVAGVAKLAINNQRTGQALAFGVDFTGGATYIVKFESFQGQSAAKVTGAIRRAMPKSVERPKIQVFTGTAEVQIRTQTGAKGENVAEAADLAKAEAQAIEQGLLGAESTKAYGKPTMVGSDLVGPVIGEYLRQRGTLAVFIGCLAILFYVGVRYNIGGLGAGWLFGVCAVIALLHDVQIMLTVYAWTMTEANTSFVAAVLTVIGYSVNDTIIIFDRIRSNLKALEAPQRRNIARIEEVVEASLWQTMARSIMTTGTTLMPLLTLFLFGSVTIKEFAFALLVGITSGAYSSIFTASPLYVLLTRRMLAKSEGGRQAAGETRRVGRSRSTSTGGAGRTEPAATRAGSTAPVKAEPAPRDAAGEARPAPVAQDADDDGDDDAAGRTRTRKRSASGKRKRRH